MPARDPLNSVTQIFDLLRREKNALIEGDIAALEDITHQKQSWISELPDAPLPLSLEQIRQIRALSDQNAELSASCQAAQKSVIGRLSEIQKIQKTMGIYAIDGSFSETNEPLPKIETRL